MGYRTYVCLCRLGGDPRYVLWQTDVETDAPDRVLAEAGGRVPSFASAGEARRHAEALGYGVEAGVAIEYDLDRLAAWCRAPRQATLDCEAALNAWNLFTDLPPRAGAPTLLAHADRAANGVYEKLLTGCNLPALTPPGESYTPAWADAELEQLRRLLELGVAELADRISRTDAV